jgi:inorganic triphosphatase YgiF
MPVPPGAEVELKFQLQPADVAALGRHALLAGPAQAKRLHATYFDTPEHALHAAGLSLRIRRSGDSRVQTLKAGGGAGLFQRGEWEVEVGGDQPDRAVLRDTPLVTLLHDGAALQPVFDVRVERELRRVQVDGGELEIALDRGVVEAGGRQAPILELELELRSGEPEMLFRFARTLLEAAPMRLSPRSKADAGYLLVSALPHADKAAPPALHPGMSVREALQAIGRAGLGHWLANEPLVRAGRETAATHQARVALRRFRAALSLFAGALGDPDSERLRRRMRALAQVLGAARDVDVVLAGADDGAAREALQARRAIVYDAAVAALEGAEAVRLALDWAEWLEAGRWRTPIDPGARNLLDEPAAAFIAEVMAARAGRLLRKLRRLDQLDADARHRVRIAVKKLRYAAEFLERLAVDGKARRRIARFAAGAVRLQDSLGELQDAATRTRLLQALGVVSDGSPPIDEAALLATARRAARRLKKIRPYLEAAPG